MSKRINRDDAEKLHDYGFHIPSRTIFLETPIDDEGDEHGVGFSMAQRVVKSLRLLDAASAEPITLIINTTGGDTFHGMGIYDAIRMCRSEVHGLVIGNACSMGSVILQACDVRTATPHSTVMYHAGESTGHAGTPYRESLRATDYDRKHNDLIDRLMYARVRTMKPKLTYEKFLIESERGIYLLPSEAVQWGLLDHVEEPAE